MNSCIPLDNCWLRFFSQPCCTWSSRPISLGFAHVEYMQSFEFAQIIVWMCCYCRKPYDHITHLNTDPFWQPMWSLPGGKESNEKKQTETWQTDVRICKRLEKKRGTAWHKIPEQLHSIRPRRRSWRGCHPSLSHHPRTANQILNIAS